MTSLHDDDIETHEAGHRIDPQADTDGDDTDTTDGDDSDAGDADAGDADADDTDAA